MVKKIDILGMELDNYTVREAMAQVEICMSRTGMSLIETISMRMLELAEEEPCVRDCIQMLDLAVIGEKEILTAAGVKSGQRMKEIAEHEFLKEFLKRMTRHHMKMFLLGETRDSVDKLKNLLMEEYAKLAIAGMCALEELSGDVLGAVNEINGAESDVILSILPTPFQENFLMENKEKLDAKIWYGLGDNYEIYAGFRRWSHLAGKLIRKKKLQSQLQKYQNENEPK